MCGFLRDPTAACLLRSKASTGNDGRFYINQVPNVPLTLVATKTPTNGNLDLVDFSLARKDAEPGQTDVRIVFDAKPTATKGTSPSLKPQGPRPRKEQSRQRNPKRPGPPRRRC